MDRIPLPPIPRIFDASRLALTCLTPQNSIGTGVPTFHLNIGTIVD
jgi:hypothetical protein